MASNPSIHGRQEPDIQRRTYLFALRILKLVRAMPKDIGCQVIARQVARSGTSIGANVEEAQGSHSKADFARRMNNARTEARETFFWLRLLRDDGSFPESKLREILRESEEILRTLVSIVKKLKGA